MHLRYAWTEYSSRCLPCRETICIPLCSRCPVSSAHISTSSHEPESKTQQPLATHQRVVRLTWSSNAKRVRPGGFLHPSVVALRQMGHGQGCCFDPCSCGFSSPAPLQVLVIRKGRLKAWLHATCCMVPCTNTCLPFKHCPHHRCVRTLEGPLLLAYDRTSFYARLELDTQSRSKPLEYNVNGR